MDNNKKRIKTFTNIPFVAVLAVSRTRLSVATATRSSSEGLEGTLSFLPNGRTSGLPTSKNRVGIRFSVDLECRLLVYRWWQREVTIWGLGRRTKAFQGYGTVSRVWMRFVHDVLAVVRKAEVERFLEHLNNTQPNILFTMELEQNRCLPFMDIRFTHLPSGALEREVYRKPTHTNRYIHADSHQPMNVKSATIRCLVDRAFKVCSSNAIREQELETIRTIMVENGYKRKFVNKVIRRKIRRSERSRTTTDENRGTTSVQLPFIDGLSQEVRRIVREVNIRCTFTAPNALQKLHNVRDSLPLCSATHAIYSIKCKTCDEEHIGESMRSLDTRWKNTEMQFDWHSARNRPSPTTYQAKNTVNLTKSTGSQCESLACTRNNRKTSEGSHAYLILIWFIEFAERPEPYTKLYRIVCFTWDDKRLRRCEGVHWAGAGWWEKVLLCLLFKFR